MQDPTLATRQPPPRPDIPTGYLREKATAILRRADELDRRPSNDDALLILSEVASLAARVQHEAAQHVRRARNVKSLAQYGWYDDEYDPIVGQVVRTANKTGR
jgi:hypothetical protein